MSTSGRRGIDHDDVRLQIGGRARGFVSAADGRHGLERRIALDEVAEGVADTSVGVDDQNPDRRRGRGREHADRIVGRSPSAAIDAGRRAQPTNVESDLRHSSSPGVSAQPDPSPPRGPRRPERGRGRRHGCGRRQAAAGDAPSGGRPDSAPSAGRRGRNRHCDPASPARVGWSPRSVRPIFSARARMPARPRCPAVVVFGSKPLPSSSIDEPHAIAIARERDPHLVRAGVLHDVVERFLGDPVERLLDLDRKSLDLVGRQARSAGRCRPWTAAAWVRSARTRPSSARLPGRSSNSSERISARASRWSSRRLASFSIAVVGVPSDQQLHAPRESVMLNSAWVTESWSSRARWLRSWTPRARRPGRNRSCSRRTCRRTSRTEP